MTRNPDTTATRKVLAVNTSDEGGGAERIARTLFQGMKRDGWDSWLVVGDQKTDEQGVMPFYASPHIDYRPYSTFSHQFWLKTQKRWDQAWGVQDYRFPYSHRLQDITGSPPDIVHLHNLHGGYFDLHAVAGISQSVPTFVTLEDCWWFSGHCAYSLDCERWRHGCGACPMLHVRPDAKRRDSTRYNWRTKQRIYEASQFYVAAPSQWILNRAEESIFRSAIKESRVIPHGVDLSTFKLPEGDSARHKLGIPADSFVVVFAAVNAKSNPFKDFATILESLKLLAMESGPPIHMLAIGEDAPLKRFGRVVVQHVGFLRSPLELSQVYQAADLYVHAANQEVFGITIAEAMACGLPVVATGVGGIPEVVEDGKQGVLVPKSDAASMAKAIHQLQIDEETRQRMGGLANLRAREHFDDRMMIARYRNWYEEVIETSQIHQSSDAA